MSFYRRKLPHWQPAEAEYFITIRLKGSLPKKAVERLKVFKKQMKKDKTNLYKERSEGFIQRKIFERYESLLDYHSEGPTWLKRKKIANLVKESIHHRDKEIYDLYAFCIMANHVHLVFKHWPKANEKEYPITDIMRNFKRYTARKCNEVLRRSGSFWQSESFDRVIRNSEELENTIKYVLNNPVKAKLVQNWKDWPFSYCKPEFKENIQL